VLDILGANAISGATIQQYTSNSTDAQGWAITPAGGGNATAYITPKLNSGLRLGVSWELKNTMPYRVSTIEEVADDIAELDR
jgi:hypothetical protein